MQATGTIDYLDQLKQKLRAFIDNELLPFEREHEMDAEQKISMEQITWVRKRSKELGFYGINLPKELGGQSLHGKKHFISAAPYADWAIVLAKEMVEPTNVSVTAFIVEKQTEERPGFELGKIQVPISGEHSTAELIFNQCRVPSTNILGQRGKGLMLGLNRINENRASWGATYLGVAQRLLDEAVDHAKERRQFGKPIAEFQAIQHMLAEMATELYAARCMLYDVIERMDHGENVRGHASMVKLYTSEVANRVADKAVQILGGQGLMKGHPVEKMYRDVRMFRILTGTSEIQKNIIAKELLSQS